MGNAVGDPIGPVLGEAVLLGEGPEAAGDDGDLHHDVRLVGADVVPP